jgi:hypothetical protein
MFLLVRRTVLLYTVLLVAVTCEDSVFVPVFDPRTSDVLLGLAIGLTLALGWHWMTWLIR